MNIQLWQACPVCDTEPCCGDCERCERHCRCQARERDAAQIRQFEAQHPGLLQKLAAHHEQGAQER